jgi:hypothetical protein
MFKKEIIKYFVRSILMIFFCMTLNNCTPGRSLSFKNTTNESFNIYQRNAIKYNSAYFHEDDEFTILGTLESKGKNIVLANNMHIWGEARRATWRFLLFLDDGTFLGMYYGIAYLPNEIKIGGQRIYFPCEAKYGNVIDFSKGIPKEIRIDGIVIPYEKIKDL